MKNIIMLSALTGVLTLSGCTMMQNMAGMDKSTDKSMDTSMEYNDDLTAPVTSQKGMLVSSFNNMTLYTFDKDTMNKSNCVGECSNMWPALVAPSNAQISDQFTTIQRADGTYQWAAAGKPLYFYVNDTEVGDMKGQGVGGVWRTVATQ